MNKLIKELATKAGLVEILNEHASEYGGGTFEDTNYTELDKFAELIVRECAAYIFILDAEPVSHKSAARMLMNHFGVE